mmetsp:Transcript_33757/g.60663  ORF Transcript_33757/g.60663 Transcript_33757/m.60663 type:complete len:200 (+) Transcript_33757:2008-2607(+)
MVATVNDDGIWVSQEEGVENEQNLAALVAPVHHVAVEQEPVLITWRPQLVQHVKHVCKLAMSVTYYNEPAIWLRALSVYHWLGMLFFVNCGERVDDVGHILCMQWAGLAVLEVVIHESNSSFSSHLHRNPVPGVVIRDIQIILLLRDLGGLLFLVLLALLCITTLTLLIFEVVSDCRTKVRLLDKACFIHLLVSQQPPK